MKIIPTVFSENKKEFDARLAKVKFSRNIQIDFMDGKFVEKKSISPGQIKAIPRRSYEAHLMVEDVEGWIEKLKKIRFSKIIFHIEATKDEKHLITLMRKIRSYKTIPMIAISPKTKVKDYKEILSRSRRILVMGVEPGQEHQKMDKNIYKRIKEIRKLNEEAFIQVDGGVTPKNIKKLEESGANAVNSGSFISDADEPRKAYFELLSKTHE